MYYYCKYQIILLTNFLKAEMPVIENTTRVYFFVTIILKLSTFRVISVSNYCITIWNIIYNDSTEYANRNSTKSV